VLEIKEGRLLHRRRARGSFLLGRASGQMSRQGAYAR
jgi:hypothetical protein